MVPGPIIREGRNPFVPAPPEETRITSTKPDSFSVSGVRLRLIIITSGSSKSSSFWDALPRFLHCRQCPQCKMRGMQVSTARAYLKRSE